MFNGKNEDKQKCLDYLCKAIMETRANGSESNNHIKELKLIDGKEPYEQVVRPIWSDNPDRNDGYYDINVTGDSAWAMIKDVINSLSYTL